MLTKFSKFSNENGIQRKLTQARTLQQNGVLERRNRPIIEKIQSMSHDCKLPFHLWSEVVSHAMHLINVSPTTANSGQALVAKDSSTTPNISNLRIFGYLAHVQIPKKSHRKLDSISLRCMFLSFDEESKAYCLYNRTRKKFIISRDVVLMRERSDINTWTQ